MDPALASAAAPTPIVFRDGLGERRRVADRSGKDALDLLCLSRELTAVPSFEFALRERVSRLSGFRHPYFGYVRSVDRLNKGDTTLAMVSDATLGTRLSDILKNVEKHHIALDIGAALCLIRQLVPAIATLHEHERDAAHGALAPERIVVTERSRLVVVEYAMGAALEQLRFSHQRYWKELRIALPRSAGLPHFDHRVDVAQIGVVALSLILGRPLHEEEYPAHVPELLASAWAISERGELEPLPHGLRAWLGRALHIDPRTAFASVGEVAAELDKVLSVDSEFIAEPASLEAFLARYHRAGVESRVAEPSKAAVPPPAATVAPTTSPVAAPAPASSRVPAVKAPVASTPAPPVVPPPVVATPPVVAAPPIAPPSRRPVSAAPPAAKVEPPPASTTSGGVHTPAASTTLPAPKTDFIAAGTSATRPKAETRTHDDLVMPPYMDEDEPEEAVPPRRRWGVAAAAVVLIGLTGVGILAARRFGFTAAGSTSGTLIVTTNPPGARVNIDGQSRGVTPITLTLQAGAHTLELRGSGNPRTIPVDVPAGTQVSQYIELAKESASGNLLVRTDPAGAEVTVDGVTRGNAPLTVADLEPGEHSVVLANGGSSVTHIVTVDAGSTASLVVPMAVRESAPASGWVSVTAPVEVELYEGARLLGTSQSERIMMSSGSHRLDLVNDTLGYRVTRTVQVSPGKVSPIAVKLPMGTVALNAIPWAEVWIDGQKVGETPIGNLQISIGPHEIVFRHPELGEQRHAVSVTLTAAARVSADLRKR